MGGFVSSKSGGGAGEGFFGDASDGNVTLGSNTTLTKDMFYDTLNLAGFALKGNGWRIFARLLVMAGGTIEANGNNGLSWVSGPSSALPATPTGAGSLGLGAAGNANGSAPITNTTTAFGGAGGFAGGAYGNPAVFTAAPATGYSPSNGPPFNAADAIRGRWTTGADINGGTGGNCGQRSTANESSSGGSGGGVLMIAAKTITGTGNIFAKGGNGGSSVAGTNGGGSGGGGGGVIMIVSSAALPGTVTTSVAGGTPGTPRGDGSVGGSGSAGRVLTFVV